jgi:hypothetical protein
MDKGSMEPGLVLIHVRFASDGSVLEIGERPTEVTVQEWFNRLSHLTSNRYETLSGGRAVFRMQRTELDSLKMNGAVKV